MAKARFQIGPSDVLFTLITIDTLFILIVLD